MGGAELAKMIKSVSSLQEGRHGWYNPLHPSAQHSGRGADSGRGFLAQGNLKMALYAVLPRK